MFTRKKKAWKQRVYNILKHASTLAFITGGDGPFRIGRVLFGIHGVLAGRHCLFSMNQGGHETVNDATRWLCLRFEGCWAPDRDRSGHGGDDAMSSWNTCRHCFPTLPYVTCSNRQSGN